jgi:hypothetical protein
MYWVRIIRNDAGLVTAPIESRVRISSANEKFGFSETEVVGSNKDYTLNRFLGQFELVSPLSAGDNVSIGSFNTRASLISATSPYGLFGTETLNVTVDGISQTCTFQISDFAMAGSATAQEVVARLNKDLKGVTASVVSGGSKIKLISNKWNGGSIVVTGGSSNSFLQFSTDSKSAMVSHVAALESGNSQPFTFAIDNTITLIMDYNAANNFTLPLYKQGVSTAGTVAGTIFDTSLNATFPLAADLDGDFEVVMKTGAQAGNRRTISSYTPFTGAIVLASPFGGAPGVGETYQIMPKNSSGIARLWNNKQITLVSNSAEIVTSSGGAKVQIASLKAGEASGVQVSGGSGNSILGYPTINPVEGADGYRHFTGLAQKAQWTVDGRVDDPTTYEGIRAAGVQVEVLEPIKVPISVALTITTREGVTLSSISNDVKSAVSAVINNLAVGSDVILSEIIVAVKGVSGVFDVKITSPSTNVAIGDSELARISDSAITVG